MSRTQHPESQASVLSTHVTAWPHQLTSFLDLALPPKGACQSERMPRDRGKLSPRADLYLSNKFGESTWVLLLQLQGDNKPSSLEFP